MLERLFNSSNQQLRQVQKHLMKLGYKLNAVDDPNGFYAIGYSINTVDIAGDAQKGFVSFSSIWRSSDYSAQNYNKYLNWVNSLNLNSFSVQFCINQGGSLSMQLSYFGEYETNAFDLFCQVWIKDIDQVWKSEARYSYLD